MKISFLIVTKNRPEDLLITLTKLKALIDVSLHEVLVFIDGCLKTEEMIPDFDWVDWTITKQSVSASPARHALYKKAQGEIFIGLDDDAHPISSHFIESITNTFKANENLGIIAFQEVKGVFETDEDALAHSKDIEPYFTNDFVGCGFAIRKAVYTKTQGFPLWVDIYGEEPAVAIEVLDLGYAILYDPRIKVNHRKDTLQRHLQRRNYFRFKKQLQNSIRFYMVYYKYPIVRIAKLLGHNFKAYAVKDKTYFFDYIKVCLNAVLKLPFVLKYRKPVRQNTISKRIQLKGLRY